MLVALLLFSSVFLAYFNGANDNVKGVATLYGSGTMTYKTAIAIATAATFLGSVSAIFISQGLISSFSGKGLVPDDLAGTVDFLTAVGFGAGSTVLLATKVGLPISTTHSLVGALVGSGLVAVGLNVNLGQLLGAFLIPLLASPFIAFILGMVTYKLFTSARKIVGITKETCICIGERKEFVPVNTLNNENAIVDSISYGLGRTQLKMASESECSDVYTDKVWGIYVQKLLDFAHTLSGAAVSFARGLNDTPKIAGLLVAAQSLNVSMGMVVIAVGMAIGGILNAHRVAETISHRIMNISHGQGFSANLVTSFLVIFASKFGVPVSTTHVSVGSIFGISFFDNDRNGKMIVGIIASWLITLPLAMVLSGLVYYLLS